VFFFAMVAPVEERRKFVLILCVLWVVVFVAMSVSMVLVHTKELN
jgi:hypothetical protein